MKIIPLRAVPNQRFTFANGQDRWVIEIKVAISSMICNLWLNDEPVLLGSRIVAGVPIIWSPRLATGGNFGILTEGGEEPWWEKFGTSQKLAFWESGIAIASSRFVDLRSRHISPSLAELTALVNTAMKIEDIGYLPHTWQALQEAISYAMSVVRSHAPEQGQILLATQILTSAVAGLKTPFTPLDLFASGEQGTYSLPPNSGSYFTDTAGTNPAELTDAIALVQGEVGPDWTQGTATARPVWAREPEGGRRNLVLHSSAIGQTPPHFFNSCTFVENSDIAPDGTLSADKIIGNIGAPAWFTVAVQSGGELQGTTYTVSRFIKYAGVEVVRIQVVNYGVNFGWVSFNVLTGNKVGQGNGGNLDDLTVTSVGGGWWRVSVVFTARETSSGGVRVYSNELGDGEKGILVWGAQAEVGSAPTPYQKVTTAADVTEAGVPSVPYARFDLADDVLTTTLPAATYTVVLPTRQGIWFDSVEHAGGSFSVGPTSYTGGPAGILTALESDGVAKLVAMPYVGREPTAAEKAALVRWYQSRGAGPELELGPELVVNGTFDTDLAGWTPQGVAGGGVSVWNAGKANITRGSLGNAGIAQSLATTDPAGKAFVASFEVSNSSGPASLQLSGLNITGWATQNGVRKAAFTPTGSGLSFSALLGGAEGAIATFDNISVRRIQLKGVA